MLTADTCEALASLPKLKKLIILPGDNDNVQRWRNFAAVPFFKALAKVQYLQLPCLPKTDVFLRGLAALQTSLKGLIIDGNPVEIDAKIVALFKVRLCNKYTLMYSTLNPHRIYRNTLFYPTRIHARTRIHLTGPPRPPFPEHGGHR